MEEGKGGDHAEEEVSPFIPNPSSFLSKSNPIIPPETVSNLFRGQGQWIHTHTPLAHIATLQTFLFLCLIRSLKQHVVIRKSSLFQPAACYSVIRPGLVLLKSNPFSTRKHDPNKNQTFCFWLFPMLTDALEKPVNTRSLFLSNHVRPSAPCPSWHKDASRSWRWALLSQPWLLQTPQSAVPHYRRGWVDAHLFAWLWIGDGHHRLVTFSSIFQACNFSSAKWA